MAKAKAVKLPKSTYSPYRSAPPYPGRTHVARQLLRQSVPHYTQGAFSQLQQVVGDAFFKLREFHLALFMFPMREYSIDQFQG